MGVVQGVRTKEITGKSQLLQEAEREIGLWRQEPGCSSLPEFLRNVKGPGQRS